MLALKPIANPWGGWVVVSYKRQKPVRGYWRCAAGWGRILPTGSTIMGSHIFGFFGVRQFFVFTVSKRTRMFVLQQKSKVSFIQSKSWITS